MWVTKLKENDFYTVHYCPFCKVQRTFHSKNNYNIYRCDYCGFELKYNMFKKKFELI